MAQANPSPAGQAPRDVAAAPPGDGDRKPPAPQPPAGGDPTPPAPGSGTLHPALRHLNAGAAEWLLLALAAPFLLFPGRLAPLGLVPLVAIWGLRRAATGRWSAPSPAHGPMLLLLVALGLSLIPSIQLDYSAPKFWGIILGLAVCSTAVNTSRTPRARRLATLGLLGGGAALALVGLVGMAEPMSKLFGGLDFYNRLPRAVTSIQTSTIVIQGFSPNQVGGTLALFMPLAAVVALGAGRLRWVALASLGVMLAVLLLTQSRSALVGVALAGVIGALWVGGRRGRLAAGAAVLVAAALTVGVAARLDGTVPGCGLWEHLWSEPSARVVADDALSAQGSGRPRFELWQRTAVMALDMPFTGIGLNTFPIVLPRFYPTEHYDETTVVPHAHNLVLHTAADLGLIGLGAFLAIVVVAVRGGLRGMGGAARPLALGLLLGLLAHAIFSLTDAVALGAKTGPALWMVLGLLVAFTPLNSAAPEPAPHAATPRSRRALLQWALPLLLVPLLVAPLGIDAARSVLHRPDSARQLDAPLTGALVETALGAARALAWGPYVGRAEAARALLYEVRGDTAAALATLRAAAAAAPWDGSLTHQLGAVAHARGDLAGATEAWGVDKTLRIVLALGGTAALAEQPEAALQWLAQAQAVAPADWRPYAAAANVLGSEGRYAEATPLLGQALHLRGAAPSSPQSAATHAIRIALAGRLADSSAPLPQQSEPPLSPGDALLFARTALALDARGDSEGAFFAAELADRADRIAGNYLNFLARFYESQGRTDLAQQARLRTGAARCLG